MESVFVELLNMSFTASLVVLAVVILRLIFRRVPKWIHCTMWVLVAFRLICPFSIESEFSVMPSENIVSQSVASSEVSRQTVTGNIGVADNSEKISPEVGGDSDEQESPQQSVTPRIELIKPKRSVKQNILHYSAYVWIIGLVVIAVYGVVSYVILRRRVSEAVRLRDNIYQCDRIASPFMMGIIRPKIYLPFSLSEQNMGYVIAHEQAHIRRRDNLTKIFAFALTAVYWFNPIIWLAYVLLCRDIELACDESVIRGKDTAVRKAYSTALLECSADNSMKFIYNASPVAFGEIGVKQRVVNVIKNKKTAIWVVCAAVAACVVAAVVLLTNPERYSIKVPEKLDNAIAQAIIDYNKESDAYVPEDWFECCGEGHAVLGMEENDDEVTVYAVCSYGRYFFMNGNLVFNTGYVAVPTVIKFEVDESGNYIYKSHTEALDGSVYMDSVKELFPDNIAEKAMNTDEKELEKLDEQCHAYAKEYLKTIGREAEVGHYADFEFKYLGDDYGVSGHVQDFFLENFPEYNMNSMYVGDFERVEDGVRYVYEVSWHGDNNGNGIAVFYKHEYEIYEAVQARGYKVSGDNYTEIEGDIPNYYETVDENGEKVYYDNQCKAYKYKLTLTGTLPNASAPCTFEVLTNDKNLTFDEVASDMLSSQYTGEKTYYFCEYI